MNLRSAFFLIYVIYFSGFQAKAQIGIVEQDANVKPTMVFLGTYHMGTPGNNVVNGKVDDVTTPKRQKQMLELIGKLKKMNPTKIALECKDEDYAKIQKAYERYRSGNYKLSKSETNQIGFRLAEQLDHKKVYCVDWNKGFRVDSLYNYETYASKDVKLDHFLKRVYRNLKEEIDEEHEKLFRLSITKQLILLNQPERIKKDHQRYFEVLRIGRGNEYVGANYLSWWYGRNMKILVNLIRITDSPNDRILVVYGAGHIKLLNQLAKESAFYQVESPLKYLESKK